MDAVADNAAFRDCRIRGPSNKPHLRCQRSAEGVGGSCILHVGENPRLISLQRITDPQSIDEGLIARLLANGAERVVLQFSKESAYSVPILEDVNRACQTFGVKSQYPVFGGTTGADSTVVTYDIFLKYAHSTSIALLVYQTSIRLHSLVIWKNSRSECSNRICLTS